jgi:cellulose synthase (UDP-forming)
MLFAGLAGLSLLCYQLAGFLIPLSEEYLAAGPSSELIDRFPLWSAIASLPLPHPESALLLFALVTAVVLVSVACYGVALWVSRRVEPSRGSFAMVAGCMALFCLASALAMPHVDTDVYLYALYARVFNVYQANPFLVPPAAFAGDPNLAYAYLPWTYTPSLYGPVWTSLSVLIGKLAGDDIVANLLAFRFVLLGFNLANAALIWKILGRLNPAYRLTGTILYAWNPVVVLQGQWHVEPMILFCLLLSVYAYTLAHRGAGLFALALSSLTKLVTAPLLAVNLFLMARGRSLWLAFGSALLVGAASLLLLPGDLLTPRRLLFIPVFAGALLWLARRKEGGIRQMLQAWGIVMLTFGLLLAPAHRAWYLVVVIGVVSLAGSRGFALVVIALTFSQLLLQMLAEAAAYYGYLPVELQAAIWWAPALAVLAWISFVGTLERWNVRTFPATFDLRRSNVLTFQRSNVLTQMERRQKRMLSTLRQSLASERNGIRLLRVLVVIGILALLNYLSWWWLESRIFSPLLLVALVLATIYNFAQLVGNWLLYLAARRRSGPPPLTRPLSVDVFVTAFKEPPALVERALAAACSMRGEHRTWLLDDGHDPRLAALAQRLGAGYLTRVGRDNAKAGNLNAALARTSGEVVVIFDIDHAPEPDFLERSLGYFVDPMVGFVQVMLTFCNETESWVARAAGESTLDYYNPTSVGTDGIGSATLVGSNALIRRTALESIGGYQPGLAEDLATSIALHAAGWSSVYVAEPLAPGLAPPDLPAWFTQQLKWARGVFELLLTAYPRYFKRLTWGQRLSYAVRMTYYWIGPVVAIHLVFVIAVLFDGDQVAYVGWTNYLERMLPYAAIGLLIRQVALQTWRHPSTPTRLLWRPVSLVYATWPVYTLAWLMAILRVPLAFRPTPKSQSGGLNPAWLFPQAASLVLLVAGTLYSLASAEHRVSVVLLSIAVLQGFPLAVLLWQALLPHGAALLSRAVRLQRRQVS